MKHIIYFFLFVLTPIQLFSQNKIVSLRIHPYSDSVKIVNKLSYYVNVESIDSHSLILPVSENEITLTTTFGTINGMSVFFDNATPPDSFIVSAILNKNKNISTSKVLYIQKNNLDKLLMNDNQIVEPDTIYAPKKLKKKKRKII